MNQQLSRQKIADGVFFNSISDPKFKHNQLSIHFIVPLEEETASVNAIVPMLLCKGSKDCPDFSKLNERLNNLYGASLSPRIARFNLYQTVGLTINTLDNRYALQNENLVRESAKLLSELFFEPNFDSNGIFNEKTLELEKQSLIDTIQSEINDKRTYSVLRCMQEMYKNEVIATSRFGSVKTAEAITAKAASEAWNDIVTTAPVEIIFSGSGSPDDAVEFLSEKFKNLKRNPKDYKETKIKDTAEKVTEISEEISGLKQGKLVLGMRCANLDNLQKENAARLMVALYGGTPFSKLFLNVRERLSLCYYCAASINVVNNTIVVDSGVENENRQKAQDEIINQLELIQQGDITEQELENTKLLLANSLSNISDSPQGLERWYFTQILRGTNTSPEQDIENLSKVTVEQVRQAANDITLDTVYFLSGKESE